MTSAPTMALGIVWPGFFTSSLAVETASRPRKVKKIGGSAALIPDRPCGLNGSRLPLLNAVIAIRTNISRTPSLTITMIALARADSLAPRTSRAQHMPTRTTAGRLIQPGSSAIGPALRTCGRVKWKTSSSSSLKYSAQPTDVAAPATPYSRIRHHPTMYAGSSPSEANA